MFIWFFFLGAFFFSGIIILKHLLNPSTETLNVKTIFLEAVIVFFVFKTPAGTLLSWLLTHLLVKKNWVLLLTWLSFWCSLFTSYFFTAKTREQNLLPAVIVLGVCLSLSVVGIGLLFWKYYRHLQEERVYKRAPESQSNNSFSTSKEIESSCYFELRERGTRDGPERGYQQLQSSTSPIYENVCKKRVNQQQPYENVRQWSLFIIASSNEKLLFTAVKNRVHP